MKRILTIILIVLLVTGIILLGMWYFGRKSAVKKGQEAPTFRQFFCIVTGKQIGRAHV